MRGYIRNFIRDLSRQKSVSFLAIGSLSIGITVALLIGMWVYTELHFDDFHKNGDHIYRVVTIDRDLNRGTGTFRTLGDEMKDGFPEVEKICRITGGDLEIRVANELKESGQIIQADENFFTFFTFPLSLGDPATCLDAPGKMVINEKTARKWFGDQNPIGQVVNKGEYTIAGVMKDIPYNSHIQADVVVPFYGFSRDLNCPADRFRTYLYAPVIPDFSALEKKLTTLSDENSLMKEMGLQCKLEGMRDVHFSAWRSELQGNKTLVYLLGVTALAILLIACINFVNLLIATSFMRARQTGVKKAFGASRKMLIAGFLKETSGYVLLALGIGILLALLFLPLFNQLADCELKLDFTSPFLYIYLVVIYLLTLAAAGAYPAFYMTRYNVLQTLNGVFKGKRLSFLQNFLLVVQFIVSIAFLILIFFVHKQVNYMTAYDLGFNKENVIYSYLPFDMTRHYEAICTELGREPAIKEVTMRAGLPMNWSDGFPVLKPGTTERVQFELCQVADNYFDMMGIKLIKGENPFYNHKVYQDIVLDENAVKQLELEEPIGAVVNIWGMDWRVKGVVPTVYSKSLSQLQTSPVLYMPLLYRDIYQYVILCKVEGNPQEAIEALEKQWERYTVDLPFSYHFLDEAYSELYKSETRLGNIFFCAMVITLLLSVCGLFAMAYYLMQRRLKEIGVRKVNGASVGNLMVLLNLTFVRLVLLAYLIACGFSWYFLGIWFENFVVHTTMSWWVFVVVGGITFAITFLTVSYLTIRAARVNPVEVLKSE